METVPVPIVDKNTKADSYTQLQIKKPYLALITETYINVRQQELVTCKRIHYEFFCKELFVVRHKSTHSCENVIYFDLDKDIIKHNCNFKFYYKKTDITPTVLDGGSKIILANRTDDKHIICTINNEIPFKILSHPYILVNRSVLCNCGIEVEYNFLLESLAMCHDANTNLVMYFTVNTAFTNYIYQFTLTKDLKLLILTNKTTSEYTLLIFLNNSRFDDSLLTVPQTLKEYISQYKHQKEIFDLKERHDIYELDLETPNKNFFTNNFIMDIFMFIIAIISVITTMIILYVLYKHNKLRTLVASLPLQHVKKVSASATKQEDNNMCNYISQFYITLALSITIIGLVIFAILPARSIKLCRGQLFSNIVKIMFFISDVQYYVPIKLCKTAGSTHVFKNTGILMPDKVKDYIWDILEIDWKEVEVTFNGKVINLPKSITIKLWDKFKVRHMMESQPILFHLMLKQGFNWFTLASKDTQIENV